MLLFVMEADFSADTYARLHKKLSWVSTLLGEVDDWVDSRRPPPRLLLLPPRKVGALTAANLEKRLAREGR